ncbi:MAG: hypothetical protein CDV28_10278 [Candidatus Electronema aureum]|uniref:Uncharacterized protein n=1 Tax=Candidatus Electronema aureum TaxID=2005002 RepID=A0A521G4K7_9BACT|nr:MAG: hypothetical protein CDV28_10278 [Candidatus Electronema aureum]
MRNMRFKEAVLTAVGQIRIAQISQFGLPQLLFAEDDEVIVHHADAWHAWRCQRPCRIQASFTG